MLEEVVLTALGLEKKKDDDLSSTSVVQVDQLQKSGESGILHDLRRTRNFIGVPNKTTGSTGASDFPQRFFILNLKWIQTKMYPHPYRSFSAQQNYWEEAISGIVFQFKTPPMVGFFIPLNLRMFCSLHQRNSSH